MDNVKKFEVKIREEDYGKLLRDAIQDKVKILNKKINVSLDDDYNLCLEFNKGDEDLGVINLIITITDKYGRFISSRTFTKLYDERLIYNIYTLKNGSYDCIIYLKIIKESGNDIYTKVYNHESIIYNSTHLSSYTRNIFNYSNFKNEEDLYLCCFTIILKTKKMNVNDAEDVLNKLHYYGYGNGYGDIVMSKVYFDSILQEIIDDIEIITSKEEIIASIIKYVELICTAIVNNIYIDLKFFNEDINDSFVKNASNRLMF